ncbi:siroheme synthase CysG [Aliikangiella sp. IMCC44359]|uniref:siroheme synthase CysG n=1 Tax=Aliikangiella sp. IMCC44359 TaxID=3459125 RepID=UPI00403B1C03
MQFFPFFHRLEQQRCLLVGGGKVALRKARGLLSSGIIIDVLSPEILTGLVELVDESGGTCLRDLFSAELIQQDYQYIIAATDSKIVNAQVAALAKTLNIPVNVVDDQNLCDFIFPAVIDRNPLTIAISNNGSSPILSRLLKQQVNRFVPAAYGYLSEFVGKHRKIVNEHITDEQRRVIFWEQVLQGSIAEAIFSGNHQQAEKMLFDALANLGSFNTSGEVYLIGAGPGDPDLLTLRAFRLLQQADVVFYDRLVSSEVMSLIRPEVEQIYVGKKRSNHSVPQDNINQLLVSYAKQGKRVARLKGGDPFVFGRGGEEIEQLVDDAIPFQVVPGITAANGCSAYAGIPLTHRDYAQSVQFVTGQLKEGHIDLNWQELISPGKTLVFYMGLNSLPIICQSLISNGMEQNMSVALIEKGTTQAQRVFVSTLEKISEESKLNNVSSPTLLIIGHVVKLSEKLQWFEKR